MKEGDGPVSSKVYPSDHSIIETTGLYVHLEGLSTCFSEDSPHCKPKGSHPGPGSACLGMGRTRRCV